MWNDPAWAFGVAFIILAISLRRALPRLIHSIADRQSGRISAESERVTHDEALEDLRRRLSELEERVDFTERVLRRERDTDKLAPPRR